MCQPLPRHLNCVPLTVAIENVLELSDRRRDLQAHVEDLPLALEADVGRPSNHTREIALGLDVLADAIIPGALLEERVLCVLETKELRMERWTNLRGLLRARGLALREGRGGSFLTLWRHFVVRTVE
jgi:hypothetical protein